METPLTAIPGVGKKMAQSLERLGIHWVEELCCRDPQQLYDAWCQLVGYREDRCVLYVYRCAVYFAETEHPDPQKLKWWYWKD